MKRFLLHTVAAVAMISAASAADLMEPIPEAPPIIEAAPWSWTGFYVGVHGGWGFGERNWDPDDGDDDGLFEYEPDGALAGAQIGADFQWNWLVLGVEADASVANLTDEQEELGGLVGVDVDVNWLASARGKLGLGWDRYMIYATGGAAWANVETDVDLAFILNDQEEATHQGWVVGGGVEGFVTENVSARLEGLYYFFDDEDFDYFDDALEGSADLDVVVIRAGINARF
jgi:outer membrane immunogenic protein